MIIDQGTYTMHSLKAPKQLDLHGQHAAAQKARPSAWLLSSRDRAAELGGSYAELYSRSAAPSGIGYGIGIVEEATAFADVAAGAISLDQFGYNTLDAGPLPEGWRFERAKPACCRLLSHDGLGHAVVAAGRDVELVDQQWRL